MAEQGKCWTKQFTSCVHLMYEVPPPMGRAAHFEALCEVSQRADADGRQRRARGAGARGVLGRFQRMMRAGRSTVPVEAPAAGCPRHWLDVGSTGIVQRSRRRSAHRLTSARSFWGGCLEGWRAAAGRWPLGFNARALTSSRSSPVVHPSLHSPPTVKFFTTTTSTPNVFSTAYRLHLPHRSPALLLRIEAPGSAVSRFGKNLPSHGPGLGPRRPLPSPANLPETPTPFRLRRPRNLAITPTFTSSASSSSSRLKFAFLHLRLLRLQGPLLCHPHRHSSAISRNRSTYPPNAVFPPSFRRPFLPFEPATFRPIRPPYNRSKTSNRYLVFARSVRIRLLHPPSLRALPRSIPSIAPHPRPGPSPSRGCSLPEPRLCHLAASPPVSTSS
ncbi:hypothetical protein G7046_g1567 [Stylonectria norvegica]|nr:hypothetical protein G7046_g1567 [Stylonectria norvegica]